MNNNKDKSFNSEKRQLEESDIILNHFSAIEETVHEGSNTVSLDKMGL